jgi:hypothetical protein
VLIIVQRIRDVMMLNIDDGKGSCGGLVKPKVRSIHDSHSLHRVNRYEQSTGRKEELRVLQEGKTMRLHKKVHRE